MRVMSSRKPIEFIGSSLKDLSGFPADVKRGVGHALHIVQTGDMPPEAKPFKVKGESGVMEIVEDDRAGTFRAVYTVEFAEAVFVLHCFQKKSKRGIKTPQSDVDLIKTRLRDAKALYKEKYKSKR